MTTENEFIPYEQALILKELGFDKPCFGFYNNAVANVYTKQDFNDELREIYKGDFQAPLYQQAFRWFREKYSLYNQGYSFNNGDFHFRVYKLKSNIETIIFSTIVDLDKYPKSYEEAELECLKKLIEIVKNK